MRLIFALACAVALSACQPTAKPAPVAPPAAPAAPAAAPSTSNELAAGTHKGVLSLVEDAGYPMFWLTLTPDGGAPQKTLINNEKAAIQGGLETMKGRHVTVTVAAQEKVQVYELAAGGASLVFEGMQKPRRPAQVDTITGVLSGAGRAASQGDLPAPLKITAGGGKAVAFDWFVTPKLQAQNGKTVTLTYAMERKLEATALQAAK
jgi:hypothetical protein